jgi:hypothetical protein
VATDACAGVDIGGTVVCACLTDVVVSDGLHFRAILIAIRSLFGRASAELGGGLAVCETDCSCEVYEMLHIDHRR